MSEHPGVPTTIKPGGRGRGRGRGAMMYQTLLSAASPPQPRPGSPRQASSEVPRPLPSHPHPPSPSLSHPSSLPHSLPTPSLSHPPSLPPPPPFLSPPPTPSLSHPSSLRHPPFLRHPPSLSPPPTPSLFHPPSLPHLPSSLLTPSFTHPSPATPSLSHPTHPSFTQSHPTHPSLTLHPPPSPGQPILTPPQPTQSKSQEVNLQLERGHGLIGAPGQDEAAVRGRGRRMYLQLNQQLNLGVKEVQRQRYKSEPKHTAIEPYNKQPIGEPREEKSRQPSEQTSKEYSREPSKHHSDLAKQDVTRIHSLEEKAGSEEEKAKVGRGRGRAALLHSHQANTQTIQPGANPVGEKSDSQEVLSDKCESVTESLQHLSLQQQQQQEVIVRQGTSGVRFSALTNYIRLNLDENKAVFEYEVKFEPDVDAMNLRHRLVSLFKDQLSTAKTFDGVTLWLPIRLPNEITIFQTPHPLTQETVTMKVIYKKRSELSRCVQLYNVLFSRIMKVLRMARVGRNYYAPGESILVPQHKLEIWPGYVTAASYQEGGLMLVVDVSHRVLRTETTYQALTDIYHMHPSDFKPKAIQALVGCIILTRYNNRTYRIDDILFDQNPLSTFTNFKGEEMKYVDYYKASYNINIVDPKQPLLVHRVKKKDIQHPDQTRFLCLVPELCYMTGMTQSMRSDFRVMKDVAHHTRITPTVRQAALRKFIANVNGNTEARTVLKDWGLTLEDDTVQVDGRMLPPETIYFANKDVPGTPQADWGTHTFRENVIQPVDILSGRWLLLYSYRDQPRAKKFVDMLKQVTQNIGIRVGEPQMVQLPDDRTETYVTSLKQNYNGQIQVAVIIFPTQREDRYSAVKRLACAELALPTQCIISRTISQDHKLRAVTLKIALQINCKLGGELWAIKIPLNGVMVCGIDVYHDPACRGESVVGFVASSNHTLTRWYSRVTFQHKADEVVHGLKISLLEALKHYHKNHHSLPRSIIVYRDGVGDGQLQLVEDHEVPQLATIFLHFDSYKPKLSYVVVQKRINARIFAVMNPRELSNPPPGSVVDHTITRPHWYDFLLVSQHVRQGTISPTHYIVVRDTSNLKTDNMQRLTYKLTHLYYNWPGTVRVPAPCLYAHKLAYLVGESVRKEPAAKLSDKLYFL